MIALLVVVMGILIPVIAHEREQANRTVCLNHLHMLGQEMIRYAGDFDGMLPNDNVSGELGSYQSGQSSLVALADRYVKNNDAFHCPCDTDKTPPTIDTALYRRPTSARVSYDFYSIWWDPDD